MTEEHNPLDVEGIKAKAEAGLMTSPTAILALLARIETLQGAWEWLSEQNNLSLDYDWPDEADEGVWQVHRISGSLNDREWEEIATGATALEAVLAAQSALSKDTPA